MRRPTQLSNWAAAARPAAFLAAVIALIAVPFVLFGTAVEEWTGEATGLDTPRTVVAVLIFGLLAADVVAPIPASLVCSAAGVALGGVVGTLVAAAGMSCGCLIGFGLARRGQAVVTGPEFRTLEAAVRRYGLLALVVCRPVPVLAEATVLVAGAMGVPFWRAVGVSTAANLGVAAAYAVPGAVADGPGWVLVVFAASCAVPALLWMIVAWPARGVRPADDRSCRPRAQRKNDRRG